MGKGLKLILLWSREMTSMVIFNVWSRSFSITSTSLQKKQQSFSIHFSFLPTYSVFLVMNIYQFRMNTWIWRMILQHDIFNKKSLSQFWCEMCQSHVKVATLAFNILAPFASTFLCERGFSTLVYIKLIARSKPSVENHMRLTLSTTQSRIHILAQNTQQ